MNNDHRDLELEAILQEAMNLGLRRVLVISTDTSP